MSGVPRDAKLCGADEAVALIGDGTTVAVAGFGGAVAPEALEAALGRRYRTTGRPRGLTILHAAGQGDREGRGLDHLAQEGLARRWIGGHFAWLPGVCRLIVDNLVEAYNLPQGVLSQIFRDIAAGRPGLITHIGLGTFVDPAHGGGKANARTIEDIVERVELGGRTWLWYKAMPVDVAVLRATAADPWGNLVMDEEMMIGEALPIATAAHNSGGIVLAQVLRLLDEPVPPQRVVVPGVLVDRIALAEPAEHQQTWLSPYDPRYTEPSHPTRPLASLFEPLPLDERRIIAARAIDELSSGVIANLGIGVPEGIAQIAAERGMLTSFTLTVESGAIGGAPESGKGFGASRFPQAIIDQPSQFDLYDGGGLDFAALGLAQVDACGDVNVSRFGPKLAGIGGFANITQTAKRLVFCGTFTAGGLQVAVEDGRLRIVQEGRITKFVDQVEQISFSAEHSRERAQVVLYVTERAVFRLTDSGLELIEVAPGMDLERDVLAKMAFRPRIGALREMPASAFEAPAGGRDG